MAMDARSQWIGISCIPTDLSEHIQKNIAVGINQVVSTTLVVVGYQRVSPGILKFANSCGELFPKVLLAKVSVHYVALPNSPFRSWDRGCHHSWLLRLAWNQAGCCSYRCGSITPSGESVNSALKWSSQHICGVCRGKRDVAKVKGNTMRLVKMLPFCELARWWLHAMEGRDRRGLLLARRRKSRRKSRGRAEGSSPRWGDAPGGVAGLGKIPPHGVSGHPSARMSTTPSLS